MEIDSKEYREKIQDVSVWDDKETYSILACFTRKEIDTIRQWFDSLQDVHPDYLEKADYTLAKKLYEKLGMRVPNTISKEIE